MQIVSIFDKCLYSVKIENSDELDSFLDQINDVEWLTEFFQKNIADLQSGFYGPIDINEAVERTLEEAYQLTNKLLEIEALNKQGKSTELNSFFKPLKNTESYGIELQKSKATGLRHKSWIRLYAVRVASEVYIITGGAIKLTANMNHTEHTIKELSKLSICREYLRSQDIMDSDSFFEFLTD